MLGLFTNHETVICYVKKVVVHDMAPVLMPIYMKPPNSCFNYLHPVQIVAVQSILNHKSNVMTQLQLGEEGNRMQPSFYQSVTVALPLTTSVDIQKPQI